MTKFIIPLLFLLTLIFTFSCKKKVLPEEGQYTISIDSIRKSTNIFDYDTVWYTLNSKNGKTPIVTIRDNEYGFANPKIVSATNKYLVLTRNFYEYHDYAKIRITVLAYGVQQSYTEALYKTTTKTTTNIKLSGKILFKTNSNWVLWDLDTKKVISTASSGLEVVDYNSTLGKILVRNDYHLYYYNEDFSTYSSYYNSALYYISNICFNGTDGSISYFSSYDNYGYKFTPPSSLSNIQPDYYYYTMYNFNASQNINAHVAYSKYSDLYYLRYSYSNNSYQTISSSSSNSYGNIEVSANDSYLLYTNNSELKIYDIKGKSTTDPTITTYYKPCFDNTSSKVSFVNLNGQLAIYDIPSGGVVYPLSNTSYSSSTIYQSYW